jgi:hypothetical protein
MDCPRSYEEASAVIEDDIEDWIFIAGEDGIGVVDNQGDN